MGKPSRVNNAGTFFVSTQTWERRRLFQVEANARLFLDKLNAYREHFLLHAYVVMPDHVHLLLTPGDISLERVLQLLKGGFSHALGSKAPVWQRGFTDHRIRDAQDAARHITYIEQNPIGAHLAREVWQYPFSSANASRLLVDALPAHLLMPPQGLKPLSEESKDGTAEAVPLRVDAEQGSAQVVPLQADAKQRSTQAVPLRTDAQQGLTQAVPLRVKAEQALPRRAHQQVSTQAVPSHDGRAKPAQAPSSTKAPDLSDYAAWLDQGGR